jgi:uncharacterized coiled-coil protein SlyX
MKAQKLEVKMTEETRIALLEQSIWHINETLVRIEKRLDTIDSDMKTGFNRLDSKIDSKFIWLISFGIGAFAGLFGMMAHAMHWF